MGVNFADNLLKIIKEDNLSAFKDCMENVSCGQLRYGRFPVLSLFYLYNSKKLIKAYEGQFILINAYKNVGEAAEITYRFLKRAGKCLRYYSDAVISPAEMLVLLDKISKLKRLYPALKLTEQEKRRMKGVYFTRYALNLNFTDRAVNAERPPMSYTKKKNIALICLSALIGAGTAAAVPFIVNLYNPFIADADGAYGVSVLSAIDFESDRVYKLNGNITLPENFYRENFNCTIKGGGGSITYNGNTTPFGLLNGSLSGITVNTAGKCPMFGRIGTYAVAEGIKLNVNCDCRFENNSAFFAKENFGTVENVTANLFGKLNFAGEKESDGLLFGGLVNYNGYSTAAFGYKYGEIRACTVYYNGLELLGETKTDSSFGGISALNYGIISHCKVEGRIFADTVDLGGVCVTNNQTLTGNQNSAALEASTTYEGWNPRAAGIAIINSGNITSSTNFGTVSASTQYDATAISAGVAGYAYGEVTGCVNSGNVLAISGETSYAGGISSIAVIDITYCISSGSTYAEGNEAYAGGILALSNSIQQGNYVYFSTVKNCIAECDVSANAKTCALAGGIVGYVRESGPYTSLDEEIYYGGGVNNCAFLGAVSAQGNGATGGICGGAGINVYTKNEYNTNSGAKRVNFLGNYHPLEELNAVGAAVVEEDKLKILKDGGNNGAEVKGVEEIKNTDCYKEIKLKFEA